MQLIKAHPSPKLIPLIVLVLITTFFTISFIRGNILVKSSEKELNPKKQIDEVQTKKYLLKEIDAKTGLIRWELTAKEGTTENNLQSAIIKDIKAEVYKDNEVVFELSAPFAKANSSTKEIYLFGDVIAKDKNSKFLLHSNQLALGMGTSIEAQKGFNLHFNGSGTVIGDNAIINDDQTKIIVRGLKEASFKDIILSGNKVNIEKDKNGDLSKATILNQGKVVLKNQKNDTLSANIIKWQKSGEVEASSNVIYISEGKTFKAGYLLLKPDKKVYAKDGVQIQHGNTKCFGKSLSFENNSQIILNGKPKAIQGDTQIIADKIIYDINTGKVEALGNVNTIVINKDPKKNT